MARRRGFPWLSIALVLAALAVAGYLLFPRARPPESTPAGEVAPPAPAPTAPVMPPPPPPAVAGGEEPEIVPSTTLPPLAESDALVREQAGGLTESPAFPRWLATDGLVQRFVAAVDNVAEGVSARPLLGFLAPQEGFETVTRDERVYVDPRSWARYDGVADVIATIVPQRAAALYRELQPLCDAAWVELGHPSGSFDDALAKAIRVLLATPIPEGQVELRPKVVTFAYADPRLEALSPAQKHLLRMGPRNMRLVQGQLRTLATALGLSGPG
jgi:DUF3014 family protein